MSYLGCFEGSRYAVHINECAYIGRQAGVRIVCNLNKGPHMILVYL
jgi:hypothetical protein